MKPIKYISALLALILCAAGIHAQLSRGGKPLAMEAGKSRMEQIQVKDVNTDRLLLEDQWAAMAGKKSQRIAEEIPFDLNPGNSGVWDTHAGGTRIWQLGIRGEGARALGLVFNRYHLEPGVRLFVFDPEMKTILGAYTDLNNKTSGMLAVSYLTGDELIIQLEVPPGMTGYGDIQLGAVRHAYRPVFDDPNTKYGSFGTSGDCNVDVNCPEGEDWQLVKRSVVRMTSNEKCTGVLVNNTRQDGKAYLLTAAHCMFNRLNGKYQATTFYFNYESPSCNGPDGINYHSISGATLLSTGDTSEIAVDTDSLDFALLELSIAPPDSFVPYYAGWNRGTSAPQKTTTLHHPSGDVMKISIDNDPPVSSYHTEPYFEELVYGSLWRILEWDTGATEGGSSGCPLFNENQLVVGTLTGGQATCENPVNDYFTRFDYAWDYYPDSLRQLKYWLDPLQTGALSLLGYDPLVGIEDHPPVEDLILLYPNPAEGLITVEYKAPVPGPAEIRIFDMTGALIHLQQIQYKGSIPVRLDGYLPGIYLLQLRTDHKLVSKQFIIQR